MAQFAERLQNLTHDLNWPVLDSTELDGAWDFTLMFSMRFPTMAVPRPPGGEAGEGGAAALPQASEPADGLTIFEAVEKQLGLRLEKKKRSAQVIVIDHIEQKPTEN